jgi:periplasmic iron binding protein
VLDRWRGPILVGLILTGVVAILALNVNWKGRRGQGPSEDRSVQEPARTDQTSETVRRPPAGFREYPIGDDVERNQIRIAAVYLPPVQMEGMSGSSSSALIHLEADIHATEGNRNGFAKDEFVPYLRVRYTIVAAGALERGKTMEPMQGTMMPMVARDGLHYGASIEMPYAGRFKLTYAIEPPSVGGLGRHADRATGVEPWWKPFDVTFDWDYPGPPRPQE